MKKCAFLSTDNLEDFFVYDRLLVKPFAEHGWQVEEVSWRDELVDWNHYEVVVIRSPWDYQQAPEAFMRCLERIDKSSAILENSLATVRWNIHKDYLQELQQRGIPIVPTLWMEGFDSALVAQSFDHFGCEQLVIKPRLSANADDTFRFDRGGLLPLQAKLKALFDGRPCMLQPFIHSVVAQGEYSLFYFGGDYSHCILKTPQQGDFRVQEEHGGSLLLVESSQQMRSLCQKTLNLLPEMPLYARLDLVITDAGLALIEVELIEPSLYFNMEEASVARFTEVFVRRYGSGGPT